nr:family 1 glycosylhydrolase [Candidatus Njordarchaeum guaymaensis]
MSRNDDFYLFPTGFLWGSCVCDYQAFGGAECDLPVRWTARHIDHYAEDFELISKKLHHNAFRTSIEWARIEPKEGKINWDAINFYDKYFLSLRETGVKTFVTLHHFTNPRWIYEYGGWLSRKVVKKFSQYLELVSKELGDYIDYCVVINEPGGFALNAYLTESSPDKGMPPAHNDIGEMLTCLGNLTDAILEGCDTLHKNSKAKVGFSNYCAIFVPLDPRNKSHQQSVDLANQVLNYQVPDATKKKVDYMGIDFYWKFFLRENNKTARTEVYPQGTRELARDFYKRYRLPVAMIESGFPTRDDDEKIKFMVENLKELHDAINEDKVNVIGYNWWCAVHSYEWFYGFKPFFALIDVEGEEKDVGGYEDLVGSLKRRITKAGEYYGSICKNNGFQASDYRKYHAMKKPFKEWQKF